MQAPPVPFPLAARRGCPACRSQAQQASDCFFPRPAGCRGMYGHASCPAVSHAVKRATIGVPMRSVPGCTLIPSSQACRPASAGTSAWNHRLPAVFQQHCNRNAGDLPPVHATHIARGSETTDAVVDQASGGDPGNCGASAWSVRILGCRAGLAWPRADGRMPHLAPGGLYIDKSTINKISNECGVEPGAMLGLEGRCLRRAIRASRRRSPSRPTRSGRPVPGRGAVVERDTDPPPRFGVPRVRGGVWLVNPRPSGTLRCAGDSPPNDDE